MIVRAAIMFSNGEVVEGFNYSSISGIASKLGFGGEKIHGFVTSSGEFVLPKEAGIIALKARQIKMVVHELTPDMLWFENDF